jgi:hypothetical protein
MAPALREAADLAEDLASGKFSAAYLARHYPGFATEADA